MPPESSLVERLCEAANPRDLDDWEDQDGYYLATCRVSPDDIPGLIDIARKWNDWDWPSDTDVPGVDPDKAELLSVTAWRALADLQADEAVGPLVDILRELDDMDDDWVADEFPHVFGKVGESAVEVLSSLARRPNEEDHVRSIAARGLRCMAGYHADTRDRIVACLAEMLADGDDEGVDFNTTLLVELVELEAVEAAERIERAFADNLLDVGVMGDWEEVRRKLGVEGLGLTMPENPHNSITELRLNMGLGDFRASRIFSSDEIDHDAAQAYYERVYETFSNSIEAQRVIERHGRLAWFDRLLEFGINYLGEIVDAMTLASVEDFVLCHVPRKVSTEPDVAASIVYELAMFWDYLDRVHKLPEAKCIAEWLKTDGLVAELEAELADPSNFGMAKSIFMLGKEAGYDMTSEAGIAEFMNAYNRSLASNNARAPAPAAAVPVPHTRDQRVGRNDPCPCGSGKKFKKCCR